MIADGIKNGITEWIAGIVGIALTSIAGCSENLCVSICRLAQDSPRISVLTVIASMCAAVCLAVKCLGLKRKLSDDFHRHLKLVDDTGYYIDKRNNKPACPKCLANGRLCYLRCEKRIDWITRQTYTQVSCLCDQHESLDRIYGDPFELDNGSLYRIDYSIIYSTPDDIKTCYGTSVEELKKRVPQ